MFYRPCVLNLASGLLQIGHKSEKGQWRHNTPTWRHHFFDIDLFPLSSLVTRPSFMKGLTRNPEIGNTPVWILPNIWRLGEAKDTKFGTNVSNKTLLNTVKCQGYSFNRFWVIKGKPTRGVKLPTHPPHPFLPHTHTPTHTHTHTHTPRLTFKTL